MSQKPTWDPDQYLRFAEERKQPFLDLVALIERRPRMHLLDLGCGTGEWTHELHEHLQAAETVGIDSSETMLLQSSAFGSEMLRFERGDIESFVTDRRYDLVFSNAALHWIGNHEKLFTKLTGFLARDGQFAVQMPANDDHPSHVIAGEVARELGADARTSDVLPTERYAQLLHRLGFKRQHVRMQIYGHLLASSGDVVEWVKGSLLTDYERRLGSADFPRFLERYSRRLLEAIGEVRPYFYTYKRILMWATL